MGTDLLFQGAGQPLVPETENEMVEKPRDRPESDVKDDGNLGQKEAERMVELEEEENTDEDEQDDELEPMTERSEQRPKPQD